MKVVGSKTRFNNKHTNALDSKNRVFIPAEYRPLLGAEFIIAPGENKFFCLYTLEEWDVFMEEVERKNADSINLSHIKRFYNSASCTSSMDSQGRIVLPQHLLQRAQIEKDVLFAGCGRRIECWNPDTFNAEALPDDVELLLKNMPI